MPITFDKGWNHLNLAKLGDPQVIATFLKARVRFKQLGPQRITELQAINKQIADKTMDSEGYKKLQAEYGIKKRDQLPARIAQDAESIKRYLERDKLGSPMMKKFGDTQNPQFQGTASEIDPLMEQIHNDRLRLDSIDLLKEYRVLDITTIMFAAKPKFTLNARVAALLAKAAAPFGDAVRVTQGVHQKDDPHFDVLMPGEAQQYHINVDLKPDFKVRSISFMNGATKAEGTTLVMPDAVPAVPVVTH